MFISRSICCPVFRWETFEGTNPPGSRYLFRLVLEDSTDSIVGSPSALVLLDSGAYFFSPGPETGKPGNLLAKLSLDFLHGMRSRKPFVIASEEIPGEGGCAFEVIHGRPMADRTSLLAGHVVIDGEDPFASYDGFRRLLEEQGRLSQEEPWGIEVDVPTAKAIEAFEAASESWLSTPRK